MQPIIIICLIWVLWTLTWMAVAIAGDPGPHVLNAPLLFVYRLVIAAATFLLFTITPWPGLDVQYRFWEHAPSEELSWTLAAITFLGFVMAWWGTIARFIARHRQQAVADNGPFRFVRQPIYLGLIVAAYATAVLFGRPSALIGATAMALTFLVKILIDEHMLRDEVPAYDDYAGHVWMFLPIVRQHHEETTAHASIYHAASDHAAMDDNAPFRMTMMPAAPMAETATAEPQPATQPAPDQDIASDMDIAADASDLDEELFEPQTAAPPAPHPATSPVKAVQLSLSLDDLDESEAERDAIVSTDHRQP